MLAATIPAAGILAFAILDSPSPYPYNRDVPQGAPGGLGAQVAQLVEHCTENAGVGGSIPPLGTISFLHSST
jgi:hypothetical protein